MGNVASCLGSCFHPKRPLDEKSQSSQKIDQDELESQIHTCKAFTITMLNESDYDGRVYYKLCNFTKLVDKMQTAAAVCDPERMTASMTKLTRYLEVADNALLSLLQGVLPALKGIEESTGPVLHNTRRKMADLGIRKELVDELKSVKGDLELYGFQKSQVPRLTRLHSFQDL